MAAVKNSKLTSASNEARKFDNNFQLLFQTRQRTLLHVIRTKQLQNGICISFSLLFTTKTAVAKGVVRENITHTLKKFPIFLGFKLFLSNKNPHI